ncbi:MAG: tRNA (adenosine(37)-N6)-threonylcarbamoyltransferase complex transferase subunit TsaD [Coriobacteriia bacterium]|nr:tRNA (adenosine(37)-N6)-threonylcarbamoyltransferase complex transferase subunit TsaD [Coriobacteriia bacterium]
MTKQQLILAFDTASDAIALAVGELSPLGITPLASGDLMARREANVRLVPAIEALFSQGGVNKKDLVGIVCGRGPGSFTGVRIAVATAKGIAAGLELALFGVVTPDAQAWQAWMSGVRGHLAVLSDAMRGEVYPVRYLLDEQGAHRQDCLTVVKSETLAQRWLESYVQDSPQLAGDALYKYGELFSSFSWLDESHWHPQGSGLLKAFEAHVGQQGELREEPHSIASLLPIYTRLSDAEENERKKLAVAGGTLRQGALTEVPSSGFAWPLRTGKPVYRPAASDDIASMVMLEQSAYAQSQSSLSGECWTEEMYQEELDQAPAAQGRTDRSWWVCYNDNALAGFVGGQLIDGCLHVLDLVVREECRRKGIGEQLIQYLVQDARDLGATSITLEVRANNIQAQTLYQKLGLKEVGRRKGYYPPNSSSQQTAGQREDALIMTGSIEEASRLSSAARTSVFTLTPADSLSNAGSTDNADKAGSAGSAGSEGSNGRASSAASASNANHANKVGSGDCTSNTNTMNCTAKRSPLILAIESSCDETAAALIDGDGRLLSNVIASQTDFHARFGGVVPEIASRKHTEAIYPTAREALGAHDWQSLDALAVTFAPGLVGALVVGMAFAKGLSWSASLPLIVVDHLEGHIYANRFVQKEGSYHLGSDTLQPPFVIALLSGGNTLLVLVRNWGSYEVLGETLDDAVGEAYDKVAKALGLGYPGGPIIAKLAAEGNPEAYAFPRALMHSGDYQFSLSGLKTAVLTVIREQVAAGTLSLPDIAASFEQAVIEVQVSKALKACKELGIRSFCIGGGVAANKALRKAYQEAMEPCGIQVLFPPPIACTDNAAMIAAVALARYKQDKFASLSSDAAAQRSIEQEY